MANPALYTEYTEPRDRDWERSSTPSARQAGTKMLLTVGVLVGLTAIVTIATVRARAGEAAAPFGWMSEQWLAEYLASHP
jgi:hypothetical protein